MIVMRTATVLALAACACAALFMLAAARAADEPKPRELPGLHNVILFHEGLYSGSAPEGDAAFAALKELGVKTVISVDGSVPEVERAKRFGMRYVHLPIGYDGFDDARKSELVRAVRDLPKPIYLHCHHGKHRSAGAASTIGVSLGWFDNARGKRLMEIAGTAEGYKGLWSCTAKAAPLAAAVIDAARADFPEVTKPDSLVEAMVAVDAAFDNLKLAEKHGWKAPKDHPDLAPIADAGRLADLYRDMAGDAHVEALAEGDRADFRRWLASGADAAARLERLIEAADAARARGEADPLGASKGEMKALFDGLARDCKACHTRFRD